jgi:hypothetical protein
MKHVVLFVLFIGFLAVGCSEEIKAPEPLPLAQMPSVFELEFKGAKPQVFNTVSNMLVAIKENDPTDALSQVDALLTMPDLSKKQKAVAVRAQMTLLEASKAAAEKGDQKTAAELKFRHDTK